MNDQQISRITKNLFNDVANLLHQLHHNSDLLHDEVQIFGYSALVVKLLHEQKDSKIDHLEVDH